MGAVATNLYTADDKLIKAGFVTGAVALFATISVLKNASGVPTFGLLIGPLLLAAPLALLGVGYAIRRREKRIIEIWRLVHKHGRMPVNDLISMTGFKRQQLRSAIDLLNRKSVAGLTWDAPSDAIRDVGLVEGATLTHSQQCSSCGASVNIEVTRKSGAEAVACPYCKGALDSETINRLQNTLHERNAHRTEPRPASQSLSFTMVSRPRSKPFNVPLFVILILFFWPAALFYAIKWANSTQHLQDVIDTDRD